MKEKKMYREENRHGSPLFPIEYYNCVYPARLPGLPVHWHEEFEITCVRKGQGTYLIDLETCPVKEGDVLFLTSGILHGIPAESTDFLETDSFVFHPSLLGGPLDLCSVKYLAPLEQGEVRFPAVISGEREPRLAAELAGMFARLKKEFEPKGYPVFPISGVTGEGIQELLYYVSEQLDQLEKEPITFQQEYFPEEELLYENLPYTVTKEEDVYVVEGPKIEKMLGYTNLDSEKGFMFFQKFLKDTGILDELEAAGIQEGDTVRMYGLQFDYYK